MSPRAPVSRDLTGEADAWQRLHAVMYRITPEIAEVPGYFAEGWTAKDAVAHLGTWMAEGAQMLRRIAAGTYREGELDVDAENERFLAAMRDVPLETVHLQAASARAELRARLGGARRRSRRPPSSGSARPGRTISPSTCRASRRGSTS